MSIDALASLVREAQRVVALTGAGVSTESGIPDFRSADHGIWREHDPMQIASIDGFRDDPIGFYEFWGDKLGPIGGARPNATHRLLAALEEAGSLRAVITQNVDGLHDDAGSREVLEVHGSFRSTHCLGCGVAGTLDAVLSRVRGGESPTCLVCGGLIKPDVVLFGEMLPPIFVDAERLARRCDVLLVLGSSLEVYPVAGLVPTASAGGARVAIVNRDPSPFDDLAALVVHAELGATMRALAERLGMRLPD